MLFPVGDIGNVVPTQGIEIDLGLSQLSEEQGDMARLQRPFPPVAIRDGRACEEFLLEPASQGFRLSPGRSLNIELLILLSRSHEAKLRS
ncbi:MAG: hypothetical protein JW394_0513 [Nitrospira sp.]|nr:hypothetical protein [Nitrospira sp.]